jgi:hypothetical protein
MKATPSHPQQTFLPFFTQLEMQVRQQNWLSDQKKKEKPQKARPSRHPAPVLVDPRQLDLLDLPIFTRSDVSELLEGEFLYDDEELIVVSDVAKKELPEEWSDEGALQAHYVLLERSLEYLAAKGNRKEKRDVLDWIFHPEVAEEVIRMIDGKNERLLVPFTFGACCRLQGLEPDEMRDQIAKRCREIGIATI